MEEQLQLQPTNHVDRLLVQQSTQMFRSFTVLSVFDPIEYYHQGLPDQLQIAAFRGDHIHHLFDVTMVIVAVAEDLDQPFA
jgi:hypothetical protein